MEEISFQADHAHKGRNRLTAALRPLIALPLGIVGIGWTIRGFAGGVLAWLILVPLGRYPRWLHAANARALRYGLRAGGYALLLTDRFPAFDGSPDDEYPIRLEVERRGKYSRLKVLRRPPLLIGIGLAFTAYMVAAIARAVVAGVVIFLTGRHTKRGYRFSFRFLDFAARAGAYALFFTDSVRASSDQ